MPYTFEPEEAHAKAYGNNMRISAKDAATLSRLMRGKKRSVVKRLLQDLLAQTRSIDGKYYTKTVESVLELFESCEANAKSLGLDADKLFVHASATRGTNMRRGRRKSSFGSRMKITNMEIMLIERGRGKPAEKKEAKQEKKGEAKK
jgi:ribosomal protein L22